MAERIDAVLDQVLHAAATTLEVPTVRADDNFFELGGDSLGVIDFCADIERATGYEMPLEVVWDTDTFAALAQAITPYVEAAAPSSIAATHG